MAVAAVGECINYLFRSGNTGVEPRQAVPAGSSSRSYREGLSSRCGRARASATAGPRGLRRRRRLGGARHQRRRPAATNLDAGRSRPFAGSASSIAGTMKFTGNDSSRGRKWWRSSGESAFACDPARLWHVRFGQRHVGMPLVSRDSRRRTVECRALALVETRPGKVGFRACENGCIWGTRSVLVTSQNRDAWAFRCQEPGMAIAANGQRSAHGIWSLLGYLEGAVRCA